MPQDTAVYAVVTVQSRKRPTRWCREAVFAAVEPELSHFGPVPDKTAQYDLQISWPSGRFFGPVNFTVACNATDDIGRPLAPVQPLPFAVVANPQLK